MPLFANTEQTGREFAPYVRDFQKLYEFHSLRAGAPRDFLQLAPKLGASEGFRLDFSDLVRTVRDRERGRISAAEMLTIVGVAIGGPAIAQSEMDLYEAAATVQVLLAGVGGWRDAGQGSGDRGWEIRGSDVEAGGAGLEEAVSPDVEAAEQGEGNGAAGGVSPEMKEALARLELANMQLKVYLDDIDRRMGRIEPHLEDLAAMVHTSAEMFGRLGKETERAEVPAETPLPRRRSEEAIARAMEMTYGPRPDAEPLEAEPVEAERLVETEGLEDVAPLEETERLEDVAPLDDVAPLVDAESSAPAEPVRVAEEAEAEVAAAPVRPRGWEWEEFAAAVAAQSAPAQETVAEGSGAAAIEGVAADEGVAEATTGEVGEAVVWEELPRPGPAGERDGKGRRRGWAGVAAALLLVTGVSLGYVYQPWHRWGVKASGGESRPVEPEAGAAARAGDGAAAGQGSPAAAAEPVKASAVTAGRRGEGLAGARALAAATRRHGRSGASANDSQVAQGQGAGQVQAAAPAETAAAARTTPVELVSKEEPPRAKAETVTNRVEGARAADSPHPARVESLEPVASVKGPEVRGGAPARSQQAAPIETAVVGRTAVLSPSPGAAGKGTVARASGGDVPPATIGRTEITSPTVGGTVLAAPAPIYPQQARQLGIEGRVVVRATVNRSGLVTGVQVIDGPVLLRSSAQDAVKRRRYKPFLLRGEPMEFQTMVTLNYKLAK